MGKWDKYKKNKNKENVEQKDTNKGLPATCINCLTTVFPILLKKTVK